MFQSLSRIDQMSNAAFLLVEAKSAVANLWLGMVSFDEGTTSSCYVKTVRPCGLTRETSALIRARQVVGAAMASDNREIF